MTHFNKCKICNKEFYVNPKRLKLGHGKFCSQPCRGKGLSKRITKSCLNCGTEKSFRLSLIKIGKGKYCGVNCQSNASKGVKRKKENLYLLNLNQRVRTCFAYKYWRALVFNRDNYTCVLCGTGGGNLNADHIKSFSLIMKSNGIDSFEKAVACNELWDLKNGRTLCKKCHRSTFNYGRPKRGTIQT